MTLWKAPKLRLFALSPATHCGGESFIRKPSLHIFGFYFIVNTLRFHYKDQSVNVGGGGVFI
jgi:hypothetical protein